MSTSPSARAIVTKSPTQYVVTSHGERSLSSAAGVSVLAMFEFFQVTRARSSCCVAQSARPRRPADLRSRASGAISLRRCVLKPHFCYVFVVCTVVDDNTRRHI